MRNVPVSIEQSPEGDWWVQSPEVLGFFACGDTRDEALANAAEALSIFLDVDEDKIRLVITETKTPSDGV
jgi:predicted RNase H-like HicB family nuclease